MDEAEIRASFAQLLAVCTTFASTAGPDNDIRDYGLTPELLAACTRALAQWRGQRVPPTEPGVGATDAAAWQAYAQMLAAHGEDFS